MTCIFLGNEVLKLSSTHSDHSWVASLKQTSSQDNQSFVCWIGAKLTNGIKKILKIVVENRKIQEQNTQINAYVYWGGCIFLNFSSIAIITIVISWEPFHLFSWKMVEYGEIW